jgi:CheY-like chemotaxis protein
LFEKKYFFFIYIYELNNRTNTFILTDLSVPPEHRPIVMIDDDTEDLEMICDITKLLKIPNEMITFTDPVAALAYSLTTAIMPFFIICDINMPKMDGFELRMEMLKTPGMEKVPFFFLSTSKSQGEEVLAEECKATGYYQKSGSFGGQENILKAMLLSAQEMWANRQ